jgi:hypothetical protein
MEASIPSEEASNPSPIQTDCELLTANALVNDDDFVFEIAMESGLEYSDNDLTTGWIIGLDGVVGCVTAGSESFDSSAGSVGLEFSEGRVFNEENGCGIVLSKERIVNSVEGMGGIGLHHQSWGRSRIGIK